MASPSRTRRDFLKTLTATSAAAGLVPTAFANRPTPLEAPDPPSFAANDQIQFATIGTGIIGFVDTRTALDIPGTELVAAADCYDARLTHVKEVFGEDVATTQDYREVLDRSDVDAVLICTPDHWHSKIARDALEAGKAVYCEKPMAHSLEEGKAMVETQKQTEQLLQVGSQFASSIVVDKVRSLIASGAIGALNMVEARYNRNSSLGAWQYTIPPNVSPEDVAWDRFLGDAPDHTFDPVRFFRWRNYWDYGTGLAGDLFVHLLTITHYVTGAKGPTHIFSTGGLHHWTDGREVPDVQTALFEYPDTDAHPPFTLSLQSNLADGSGGGRTLRFVGDEGVISLEGDQVTLLQDQRTSPSVEQLINGYNSVRTFSKAVQAQVRDEYTSTQDAPPPKTMTAESEFEAPDGYSSRRNHFANFFSALRNDESVVEDAVFGHRAAAAALLCNRSYREGTQYQWDPESMTVVS
jgi:predicted dehydrogenase